MIWGVVVGAAVVVAIAGVAKLAKPEVTSDAVRSAGLPASRAAVTLLGAVELLVGVTVVVWQLRLAALALGLLYLGFVVYSVRLLIVRGTAASCGCFGQRQATVGIEHVVVNLAVALVVFDAAAGIGPDSVDPVAAIGATALLFVLLAIVPSLRMARR
ncbi:MAG TPA: MauE/DoxX family redox-associated membrane protein [Acidimicrobiales bacterium]|nr:MauE/DoxX family redox-associated membrane protein [Acidimicrobiales bacterium]